MDNCTINGYLALIACIFGRSTPEQALHDYCGVPLRRSDLLKEQVRESVERHPTWENSEIAASVGCTEDYVSRFRRQQNLMIKNAAEA